MIKLRIKTCDDRVERISVADNGTLGDLKEVIATSLLQHLPATQVRLSLNKKVVHRCSDVSCSCAKAE